MTDNQRQMASASYRLAALDRDFLLGDSMRGVRFQLEYGKAEEALRAHRIISTVVVFGSARVRETGSSQHRHWYNQAREFGALVSQYGGALNPQGDRHHVIMTGGGPGIMEAANRGAHDVGAINIGLNITLPHEQEPNPYSTPELTFRFHYFALRKMHFAMRAAALVVFPGGFGTFDELFELLTLVQTQKMRMIPVILVDRAFWSRVVNLPLLAEEGLISAADLALIQHADSAQEAWSLIQNSSV